MREFFDHPEWFADANCRGLDPDLMFPGRGDDAGIKAAKAVCAECVVRDECLTYAIEERIQQGVFGGLSGRERRQMRRRDTA